MKPIDIVIIVVVAVALIGVVAYLIKKKMKGETGCGCGCSSCPSAGSCCGAKPVEKEETPAENADEAKGNGNDNA